MNSINPYNNQLLAEYKPFTKSQIDKRISDNKQAWLVWKDYSYSNRTVLMLKMAALLRSKSTELATLITLEMGKRIAESRSEIEKCAWVCEYYANHASAMLETQLLKSDASKSMVTFEPLGAVLAVMPWNFPFWQVFRFAAPAIMAGNAALLKHASNVQGCALEIEKLFNEAGFPENLFTTLVIGAAQVEQVLANDFVAAVTLTGSESAGSQVAALAGKYLKKSVLELGGSDPFIVLEDANLELAANTGVQSRMVTSGQTCISAKRFFVVEAVAAEFIALIVSNLQHYKPGNPLDESTTLAPLSNEKFVAELHQQVVKSVVMGATVVIGGSVCAESNNYYQPTLVVDVTPEMPIFCEETFGPVIALTVVKDAAEAIALANNSKFGLGASVWTGDVAQGEQIAHKIEAGAVFVNGIVKSDPRLPFGGIKKSGFGRELSHFGITEFVNIKTIWIG